MKPYDAITEFIFLEDIPEKADIILVAGGRHPGLAEKAAELYLGGFAPYILISGGPNPRMTEWKSEYEKIKDECLKMGIPETAILKEDKALNTFDNARNSWAVIQEKGLSISKAILVCKSHHARRALLTYQTVFPLSIQFQMSPVIDERDVQKDNWFHSQEKIDLVLTEVEKIGKYFAAHVKNWK